MVEPVAKILNKLADNTLLAEHFHNLEHEVGGGDAFIELAGQFEADHFRDQHGDRLTKHRGFRLDTTDAPAQNRQAIDHGGVAVCADACVGVSHLHLLVAAILFGAGPNGLCQIFQVHLVTDACSRRHNAEIVKGL